MAKNPPSFTDGLFEKFVKDVITETYRENQVSSRRILEIADGVIPKLVDDDS